MVGAAAGNSVGQIGIYAEIKVLFGTRQPLPVLFGGKCHFRCLGGPKLGLHFLPNAVDLVLFTWCFHIRPPILYSVWLKPFFSKRLILFIYSLFISIRVYKVNKKGKRKVQGVPQSQTAVLPRHQEEEETDKSKQAQIEQTYEKH